MLCLLKLEMFEPILIQLAGAPGSKQSAPFAAASPLRTAQQLRTEALQLLLKSQRLYEKGIDALDVEDCSGMPEPEGSASISWKVWKLTEVGSVHIRNENLFKPNF